eukprot:TRINITY_DN29283_c0_g1_i1.p1 TRINITY_DN29283_c0_g1~~TRINITY_DN29283_c0_g1_i1.p1  ORF type:complete len:113 (-),score=38.97 TRINITY_DN29283_c0_g1_i1:22-360(-)
MCIRDSTTTVGALVAVDMSGMAADVQGSALVTVLVQCEDTTEEPIGYIQRNAATGAMSFFSVDDTPATSYPTCSLATDVSTNSLANAHFFVCLLYTSPSPRDRTRSRMPSSA